MPLSSLFKRQAKTAQGAAPSRPGRPAAPPAGDEPPPVQAARLRARRRLIGAVVLLGVGIVGFPLLFETAPRPISVDIPIEIPRKDGVAPLPSPPATAPRAGAGGPGASQGAVDLPSDAGSELPAPATVAASAVVVPTRPPAASAAVSTALRASSASTARANDGQRAKALLEGTAGALAVPAATASGAADAASGAADKSGRFVVQVGAYTDTNALREARQKVEKLGLKTYTQVVETEGGKRTRVRVGPFATREEADNAVRTLKAASLPANILVL